MAKECNPVPLPTKSTFKMEFAERSVRQQLLLAFGGTVGSFFILLVGLCAAIIFSLSEMVIAESRSALTEQIVKNSQLVLGDVGMTLDAIIAQGAAALVLPLLGHHSRGGWPAVSLKVWRWISSYPGHPSRP